MPTLPNSQVAVIEAATIIELCLRAKRSSAAGTIELAWPLGVAARLVRAVIDGKAKRKRPIGRTTQPLLAATALIEAAIVVNDDAGANSCQPDYSHLLVLAAASLRDWLERSNAVALRPSPSGPARSAQARSAQAGSVQVRKHVRLRVVSPPSARSEQKL